jgi:hypothetical protein
VPSHPCATFIAHDTKKFAKTALMRILLLEKLLKIQGYSIIWNNCSNICKKLEHMRISMPDPG